MPRPSSSVILHRDRDGLEVFLAQRSMDLRFFGGYWAFPGGRAEPADADVSLVAGADLDTASRLHVGCALRELWEETGVLASRGRATLADASDLALDAGAFHDALQRAGGAVDPADFVAATRLVTPPFSRLRYDTRFYALDCSAGRGEPRLRGDEFVDGRWWRPADALAAWRRGEMLIAPPAIVILDAFASRSFDGAITELRAMSAHFEGAGRAIPWGPGTELLPFHTPPLPPTVPTHAFLVGCGTFVIIDPTPSSAEGRAHLIEAIDTRIERGDRVAAVVLSHHHNDHIGALDIVRDRWRLPLWAHPRTGELIGRTLDRELGDGDAIDLGDGPDGRPDWRLECLFTPGHAQGHLAFWDERHGAILAGDMISTIVSMYVGSPGGHLLSYFESLERLAALDARILYPSHGPPSLEPRALIERTIAHRKRRLAQVRSKLGAEPRTVDDIATEIYRDIADSLRELFVRATRAALEYWADEGAVEKVADDTYRAAP